MKQLGERTIEAVSSCELRQDESTEARWFLLWVGLWIAALAALLPALI